MAFNNVFYCLRLKSAFYNVISTALDNFHNEMIATNNYVALLLLNTKTSFQCMPKIQQYLQTNIMLKSILWFPCLGSLPSRRSYFRCTAPIYLRCVLREWLSIMREETHSDNDIWYSLNMSKHYLKFQKILILILLNHIWCASFLQNTFI